jgi:hypothetical protein
MALEVEDVVDGCVYAEKLLRRVGRFEALHFPLPPSRDLVRVLGAIVHPQSLLMTAGQTKGQERGGIGAQLVGDRQLGRKPCLSSLRISLTAARLSRRGWISRSRISPW